MRDVAARLRAGLARPALSEAGVDPRIRVDLAHLRALEGRAKAIRFLPRQPARSVLNGRHASRLRGRGLNFEELRGYLPGGDVRSIDWKVTARTGEPHVRVYTEERDRPALLLVDQRMAMFFGSRLSMKSVTAAEAAALAAFRILDQGDRVGGIVFGNASIAEIRPQRSRGAVDRLLAALAEANARLRADAPTVPPMPLDDVLTAAARIARRDHLVILLSDFDGLDERTALLLGGLGRHAAPPIRLDWFNLDTGKIETAALEGFEIVAAGELPSRGIDLRAVLPQALAALAVMLGLGALTLRLRPRIAAWRGRRRAWREASEGAAYSDARAALARGDVSAALAAIAAWNARLPPVPGTAEEQLRAALAGLGATRYGPAPGQPDGGAIGAALSALSVARHARRRAAASAAANPLPPLNPLGGRA